MRPEIKICGLTNVDDARAVVDLGADYLGFVLYEKSPRGISAGEMMAVLDKLGTACKAVGVFVNESSGYVEKVARDAGLHAAQVHGDEDAAEFAGFPVTVWRAVRAEGGGWIPQPASWEAERYVIDASVSGMYGGTGVTSDWESAAGLASERKVMLSGGLTPDNVAEGIRAVRPQGVDVASGVEARPGKKDHSKLRAFFESAAVDL